MPIPVNPELMQLAIQTMNSGSRRRRGEAEANRIFDFNASIRERNQRARQAAADRATAEFMQGQAFLHDRRMRDEQLRTERQRAFGMQRVAAKERIKSTPSARTQFTGPRPGGGGYVSGAAGRTTLTPDGQMTFEPSGQPVGPEGQQLSTEEFLGGAEFMIPRQSFAQGGSRAGPSNPLVEYLNARRHEIPPNQFEGLSALAATGKLTANQLVNQIEDAVKVPKAEGRTAKDIELNIARLQSALAKLTPQNDVGGVVAGRMGALLQDEERKLEEMQRGTNPQRGHSISNPNPTPEGKPFPSNLMDEYLDRAGGNPHDAMQLAREDGYTF